jgi:CelD/BcsL family acetyltransferase involved in cellulose biosynthesis
VFWYRPGIPFRRLELLGSGENEEDEIASEYIGLIAETGREDEVADAAARALESGELGAFDEMVLSRMNGDSASTQALTSALAIHSLAPAPLAEAPAYYISLPETWDEYLALLSSSRRYRLKRALRDFEKWSGGEHEVIRSKEPGDLTKGFQILADLHAERWRASGRGGAFASTRFFAFHERVLPVLLEQNALELIRLEVRGEPVAAVYNIVWDGRVHFYQSGRKMDVPKKIRPGVILHAFAIQTAIDNGRREYDFLAGTARYKEELSTATRPLSSVRATRPALLREHARRLVRRGAKKAREMRAALFERS